MFCAAVAANFCGSGGVGASCGGGGGVGASCGGGGGGTASDGCRGCGSARFNTIVSISNRHFAVWTAGALAWLVCVFVLIFRALPAPIAIITPNLAGRTYVTRLCRTVSKRIGKSTFYARRIGVQKKVTDARCASIFGIVVAL